MFSRINPRPLSIWDFLSPLTLAALPCVLLSALAYSIVFLLAGVLIILVIPQLFVEKFGLNTEQIGLNFIGILIGTILGEQIGGRMSDSWMFRRQHQRGEKKADPEFRLWFSYPGYLLSIIGVVVFLVQIERASDSWNVTPIVGAGIAAAGNQIVTTVLITYAVDCYRDEAASVGVFITFFRQTLGFIGPFW